MGKCKVVVDFGNGKTKISGYQKEDGKQIMFTGAIIEAVEGGLESPETYQNFSNFLLKMKAGPGDLYVVLPEDEVGVFCEVAEYPISSPKELSGMIKNNLSALVNDDVTKYYHDWRQIGSPVPGQGSFQTAAVKNEYMDMIQDIAEKYKLRLTYADIATNAVEHLAGLLQKSKHVSNSANEATAIVEVGYKSARVVVFTKDRIIRSKSIKHDLFRMDKIIYSTLGDLKNDKNIVPEFLKMNPSFAFKVSQYQSFLQLLTSEIIRQIKQAVAGEEKLKLSTIYFAGGMYKMPQLVSTIKDSFDVPCYAFPLEDFVEINHGCVQRENNRPYPSDEVFITSVGALFGGM